MDNLDILPEITSVTARSIASNATRLGLSWIMSKATVVDATDGAIAIVLDGDTEPIGAISMVGVLWSEARVYVLRVPPGGNYICGFVNSGQQLGIAVYNNIDTGDPASGTTTSATYVNMPGPMTFTVVKYHVDTQLLLGMSGTWFDSTGTAGTSPAFGINIAGASSGNGDVNMTGYRATIPAGIVRLPIIAAERLAPCGSGTITLTARWFRNTGAGTLGVAANVDHLYMKAQEVWVP